MTSNRYSANDAAGEPGRQETQALSSLLSAGRYAEAAAFARALTERFPLHAFGWKMLGGLLQHMGKFPDSLPPLQKAVELLPRDAEAASYLGYSLHNVGRWDEAEASYRRAILIQPDFADAYFNLGISLRAMGRLEEAAASYRRSLEIKPDGSDVYYNLGNTLKDMRRLDEAAACYRQATQARPDYIDAHYNLGVTLSELGRADEAEASYRRALQIKPDFAEARNYLGITLKSLGRLGQAEACYRQALQIKPDFVEALNNLALLLNDQRKVVMALDCVRQSLRIRETAEAKSIFSCCIRNLRCRQDDREMRITLARALTEPWGRPSDFAQISTDLLKLSPDYGSCAARAARAWPERLPARDLYGTGGLASLAEDALLCALLNATPICDVEMERFLTMARRVLLDAATQEIASAAWADAPLDFYGALACQCFINEYVFCHTDDEIRQAGELRDSVAAALETEQPVPPLCLIAVSAYFPLCTLPSAARLAESHWPEAANAVLAQQIGEPAKELQLRATIPRLTDFDNAVSLLVQEQYEENPFPRWVKTAPAGKALHLREFLCQKFPLSPFERQGKTGDIDLLIAGCGTGRQPIDVARQFSGVRVLAVDLSMSSLAYAKRKTLELGLTSIEYAQADILKLDTLGRRFDVIESVGVLHHLADPWAGWRTLLSLLRPGGFMRLGFYSAAARRNIVKARAFIAERGYSSSAADICRCRQDLMAPGTAAELGNTVELGDFFSTSTCRDLLFHAVEHRMTLSAIDAFLQSNGLTFLGFDVDGNVLHAYRQRFPDDPAAINLAQWQLFENDHPDIFIGMYQFWIQKAA